MVMGRSFSLILKASNFSWPMAAGVVPLGFIGAMCLNLYVALMAFRSRSAAAVDDREYDGLSPSHWNVFFRRCQNRLGHRHAARPRFFP